MDSFPDTLDNVPTSASEMNPSIRGFYIEKNTSCRTRAVYNYKRNRKSLSEEIRKRKKVGKKEKRKEENPSSNLQFLFQATQN